MRILQSSLDGYMRKYYETAGYTVEIVKAYVNDEDKPCYDYNLLIDNQKLEIQTEYYYPISDIYFTRLGSVKDETAIFFNKEAFDEGNEVNLILRISKADNVRKYYIRIYQLFMGNAKISLQCNDGEIIRIPIGIDYEHFSREEYLEQIKSELRKMASYEAAEEDFDWIDAILSDSRLLEYLQKVINHAPRTYEEAHDYIISKRKKEKAKAFEQYKKALDKAQKKYLKACRKSELEADIAVDQLIEVMSSTNQSESNVKQYRFGNH